MKSSNYDEDRFRKSHFSPINLEDNEKGLGYREFDEELLVHGKREDSDHDEGKNIDIESELI